MNSSEEILIAIESLLDLCKFMRQHYMEESLNNFRINARDFACFCDGKYSVYDDMIGALQAIHDAYDDAGAGATS